MFNIRFRFPKFLVLLLVVCITCFTAYIANSQQLPLDENLSETSGRETYKFELASELLLEIGIAKRYDMHFDHLIGALIGNGNDFELYARFREMFVRETGWEHFKDAYVARLEADFSEDELEELLNLSRQPVIKRLLQSEVNAYMETSTQRFEMGFELWNNYNLGRISLPPD